MNDALKSISFSDEIRIGIKCIKKGLIEFSAFGPTTVELFIPLLLLSIGFERILKVLYCINFYEKNNRYPNKQELQNIGHELKKLLLEFEATCNKFPLYKDAPARIQDIHFIKNNVDFIELINILNEFSKDGRYYNLNLISDNNKDYSKPEELISSFLNRLLIIYPELTENLMKPPYDTQSIYDKFNPYIIELVQTFSQILCFAFTQGAYGDKARQLSAGLLGDFLYLKKEQLSKINFIV